MGWLDTPTLFSGLNAWIVVFDVEHEEYLEAVDLTSWGLYPLGLPLTSLRDLPLLFVYFQVNNDVLYYLDYIEDIYIRALSVLVSTLDPKIVFTTSNKLYGVYNNKDLSLPVSILKPKSYLVCNIHY